MLQKGWSDLLADRDSYTGTGIGWRSGERAAERSGNHRHWYGGTHGILRLR